MFFTLYRNIYLKLVTVTLCVCVYVCVWSLSNRIIPCGVNKIWLDLIEEIMMDKFCLCAPDQLSIFLQIHF